MKTRDERRMCNPASKEHIDATRIVEHLLAHNGQVEDTQDVIARKVGMLVERGGGMLQIDRGRFNRARNHIKDRVDENGKPCCAYTINYRRSGSQSVLSLIDPSGDLGFHAVAAIETIRGWASREKQHATENMRMIETCDLLGDHALSQGDRQGYRLLMAVVTDLDRGNSISGKTLAELETWLESLHIHT